MFDFITLKRHFFTILYKYINFLHRPVLESQDGHLVISSAKDRNITLKIIGGGYVNVNEINLLHVASAVMNIYLNVQRNRDTIN